MATVLTLRERLAEACYLAEHKLTWSTEPAPWDELGKGTRDVHLAQADAVLALLSDKLPPSDAELRALPPDVGTVPFGDVALRTRYEYGFARGRCVIEFGSAKALEVAAHQLQLAHAEVLLLRQLEQCVRVNEETTGTGSRRELELLVQLNALRSKDADAPGETSTEKL